MKKFLHFFSVVLLSSSMSLFAQQVPNSNMEDWSGAAFDGHEQPAVWHYSNVEQLNIAKFNFSHKESGHSGQYSMMVQDQDLKVAGIGETSPGYIALGQPWCYVESIGKINEATAGTEGGINWTWRPDTVAVWIKRTGSHTADEDFHILYYSWSGTAYSSKYKGKNGNCTSVSKTDEESDIRQSTDGNECGTDTKAHQVSEGWLRQRATYNNWTQVKIPIYYIDNVVPSKMNIIFSASNYPNFRANDGLYNGNSLYIDDLQLIYSSKIQQLFIDGSEWRAFDPNSTEVQVYSLGETATTLPTIKAFRGAGTLTNTRGKKTTFYGRQLDGSEITITDGTIDGEPTRIAVQAEDGSSTTTYQIQFVRKASTNAYLAGIQINGEELGNFNPYITSYTVSLPYGTTSAPQIDVIKQEDKQTVSFTPPSSLNDVTTITVTAADMKTTQTYTLRYAEAQLADNTLQDIIVNGISVPGFTPTKTTYKVSIPVGTTEMPNVDPVSGYPDGAQTIVKTAPATIDGGVYQIAVTTPGNPTPKIYKLTFKAEPSSYSQLKSLSVGGQAIDDFQPDWLTYYVNLPIGTTALPSITYVQGDPYQTVDITEGGLDGTTRVSVTAGNGTDKTIYKIVFTTEKSEICTLNGILIGGEPLTDFAPNTTSYSIQLPIGTTEMPEITPIAGDEYETITILNGGLNGITRITVSAGNGATTIYQLSFNVEQATDPSLQMIYIDGTPLPDFDPETLTYDYELPQGTIELPQVTYLQHDKYQTVTVRSGGIDGEYKIIVRPQSGSSRTYSIRFSVSKSSNVALRMIYLDGVPLTDFDPEKTEYTDTLDISEIPSVTYLAENGQKVMSILDDNVQTIKVIAESGATRTYTITFIIRKSESAFLKMIYLSGDSLPDFAPEQLSYTVYIKNTLCPHITVDKSEGQQVTIMAPYMQGVASIVVTAGEGKNTYLLHVLDTTSGTTPIDPEPIYEPSDEVGLLTILLDGEPLPDFTPEQHTYAHTLEAGSSMPVVTFVKKEDVQSVISGPTNKGQYTAVVTAENGNTAEYSVTITIQPYDNALLKNISLAGRELHFEETTFTYDQPLDNGENLPTLTFERRPGQTVMVHTICDTAQQIIVTAESGRENIYTIRYTHTISHNALLQDIRIDGVSLAGFAPDKFTYTDTLPRHTEVVPCVNAVGQVHSQIITTYFSAVNGVTRIHVTAEDGVTETDYTIGFPVRQSSNTELGNIYLETELSVELEFLPEITDYTIILPYSATQSPHIIYSKAEDEQSVTFLSRPLGQANELTVTAENGDTRTYSVTFIPTLPPENNVLQAIYVAEIGAELDLSDPTQHEFDVVLPYGAKQLTVSYSKTYASQFVVVESGGIARPTYIKVYPSHSEQPAVYTLRPIVTTRCPASLDNIAIDGIPLPDFDPDRLTYIVNRANDQWIPQVETTCLTPHATRIMEQDTWHWSATVTSGAYTRTYSIYWHYTNYAIPNGEFTQWTKTAKTSSLKPTGWNATSDYVGEYKAENYVQKATESVVRLNNSRSSTLDWAWSNYGCAPAIINLAQMSAEQKVSGGSRTHVSGTIPFYNTPDEAIVNYRLATIDKENTGALFRFKFKDNTDTEYTFDHRQTSAMNAFQTAIVPLSTAAKAINGYDIIIDAASATLSGGKGADGAQLYIDYVRFGYNNALQSVLINGKQALISGRNITDTLSSPSEIGVPECVFKGEVADQSRQVIWIEPENDGAYSVRTATVTNYAEDGAYRTYNLSVARPLETYNGLRGIKIGGVNLSGFVPETKHYTYRLTPATKHLPDVEPIAAGVMQQITTSYADSTLTITVMPELGQAAVYTVHFVTNGMNDVTLKDIQATGLTFTPEQTRYTIVADQMPDITFTKQSDGQTVYLHNGILDVTAENGDKGQYIITLQHPTHTTSGQLAELELDGNILSEFSADRYNYEHAAVSSMAFVRKDNPDSVIYTQTPTGLTWQVFGSVQHTYTVLFTEHSSSNTLLKAISVNNEVIDGFAPQVHDYTLYTDTAVLLSVEPAEQGQTILISRAESVYSIAVTAPDGTIGTPYTLTLLPQLSDDATLQTLLINGQPISAFRPDSLAYTITLPSDNPKQHQPTLASVSFIPADSHAQVEIAAAGVGQTTYLTVTSGDGSQYRQYEISFIPEKSHNASLSAIFVNGIALDRFDPERTYYSFQTMKEDEVLTWHSLDKFQQVSETINVNCHTLRVTAEDAVTTRDYIIDVFHRTRSNDATLAEIRLDGLTFDKFLPQINNRLTYQPGQNTYIINLPSGTTVLPEITATCTMDGQLLTMRQEDMTVYLDVTAQDEVSTNTYTLEFKAPMSSNTLLRMIYLNGDPMPDFNPATMYYFIDLPVGTLSLPEIYAQKQESKQTVSDPIITTHKEGQQVTLSVTSENKEFLRDYILIFRFLQSDADTLRALYADGELLPDFTPHMLYYNYVLPVGTNTFPTVMWEAADKYQSVTTDTINRSATHWSCRYTVTAQSGRQKVYTVSYSVLLSSADTLQMIYINGTPLPTFDPLQTDYAYTLPQTIAAFPDIYYIPADPYQTVTLTQVPDTVLRPSLGSKARIDVMAQNGNHRTYTILFPIARSTNASLAMIQCDGLDLPAFDELQTEYTVRLEYGITRLPIITYQKGDSAQQVDIALIGTDTVRLLVTAEDERYTQVYRLIFQQAQSPDCLLADIYTNGTPLAAFEQQTFEYELTVNTLPDVPVLTWLKNDEFQQLQLDTFYTRNGNLIQTIEFHCTVTAPDKEHENTYVIIVHIAANTPVLPWESKNARLRALYIRGALVSVADGFDYNFHTDTLSYRKTYPVGTDVSRFFTQEDVTCLTDDSLATVLPYNVEITRLARDTADQDIPIGICIHITVIAPDQKSTCTYHLYQNLLLDSINHVSMIWVEDNFGIERELDGFDTDIYDYEYVIRDTRDNAPAFRLEYSNTDSRFARYEFERGEVDGAPFLLTYRAEDGTKYTYSLYFVRSTVKTAQKPMGGDVLVQHIPGSYQIAVACLRTNIMFGLYDVSGHMIWYNKLEECDPNNVNITTDGMGQTYFSSVKDYGLCDIITLEPNKIYLWVFTENGKRRIKSGKIVIKP